MVYMMCYDIRNPKRLSKVARTLESHGIRVQKSFFQCEMSSQQMRQLRDEILRIIHNKEDSFYIYSLCESCSQKALKDGQGELVKIELYEVL